MTLQSVEMFTEYEPGVYIEWISPTPLMMVVAAGDHLTGSDEALAGYHRALEPEKLMLLPGGHFDAYVKAFEASSHAAANLSRCRRRCHTPQRRAGRPVDGMARVLTSSRWHRPQGWTVRRSGRSGRAR